MIRSSSEEMFAWTRHDQVIQRTDTGFLEKLQQLFKSFFQFRGGGWHFDAFKKLFGVALLKIGPSTTPDEEGVSGKEHSIDFECGAGIGVSRG